MKRSRLALAALFALALPFSVIAQQIDPPDTPPAISADKNVYAPGEIATITGEGWTAGETVTIELRSQSPKKNDYTLHSTADANGGFVNQEYIAIDGDIGTRFTATASGSITGAIVQTNFVVAGKPLETGKPDIVRLTGPFNQDKDLRTLPRIPTEKGYEPRRLMRHPIPPTEEQEEEAEMIIAGELLPGELFSALLDSPRRLYTLATPLPALSFDGINSVGSACGCLPPDTDGDVGPNHYIQTVNNGIQIFSKTGTPLTSFISYNAFFAPLGTSTPCGNQNKGDGVVFYDHLADRWVVSDFAFGSFPGTQFWQCIGVSKTPNPISGGYWLYALRVDPANPAFLGDYPKFAIWHNAYYLTMNMFSNNTTFNGVRVYALDRAGMVNGAGAPSPLAIGFSISPATLGDAYSLLPATFRYGAPPADRDEYLLAINSPGNGDTVQNSVFVWRFHADFANPANSVFGVGTAHAKNATITVNNFFDAYVTTTLIVPQTGTTFRLDTLGDKLMYPLYYQNLNGVESIWASHTVNNNSVLSGSGPTGIRWYQFDVTSGGIPSTPAQQQTFTNGGDGLWRWMPSLAVDSNGNMAIDYTVSSAAVNPSIRYAARVPSDPLNTLGQGEALLIQGAGHQTSSSGRWGDYSATGVDPADGCTFWHTNEYFAATSSAAWSTRIGTFKFPSCVPPLGTLQGTVTAAIGGAPIAGATITAGANTATTNAAGVYQLSIPTGAYAVSATAPGYIPATTTEVTVDANGTTIRNFALAAANTLGCITDTSQADFQSGTLAAVDVNSSPGDVKLGATPGGTLDVQQVSLSTSGNAITTATWAGQTFVPLTSGALTQLDVNMFCSACAGVIGGPVTVEIRNVNGTLPGTTVLATTTINGFNNAAATFFSAIFTSPARLNAGTTYSYTLRGNAITGTYAATRSASNVYASGAQFISTNAGVNWTAQAFDLGFRTFMSATFVTSGEFTSSTKDANPLAGSTPMWGTLTWNAVVPANTVVKFQAAASNGPTGPFTFVGPGNDPAAFFTTIGGSLSQFNGFRYLQYKAFLSTTVNTVTPTLNDVTICFDNRLTTALLLDAASGTYGGATTLTATLTSGASPVSGKPIAFTLNGSSVGSASTDVSGIATLSGVSLAGISANSYADAVTATFVTDNNYLGSNAINTLTVNPKEASVTPDAASKIYGDDDPAFTGTLSGFLAADGVTATYSRTPGETVAGNPYTISATLSPEAVLPNYAITYNTADFSITTAQAIISVVGYSGVYDGLSHGATGTATGAAGENLGALLNLGSTFKDVPGGTANWVFAGNSNYAPAAGSVDIIITKATLTVTADNKSRLYSQSNPTLTASYSGFKNGETLATSGVGGSPALTTTATQSSAAGTYPINISAGSLAANNYSFAFVDGTLTIFVSGLVGLDSVSIGASKGLVDSFNATGGYPASLGSDAIVLSNGAIEINGAKVFGNVLSSRGSVHLAPGSQVSGSVTAGTTINNEGTAGSTNPDQPSGAIVANAVPNCGPFSANPGVTGGKFTYSNGDLAVASNSTVMLAGGTYCFHNMTLTGNASLQISGPVVINLTGALRASGGSFVNTTHVPSHLQIATSFTGPDGVAIAGSTNVYLTVYAPGTSITVTGGSPVFGALLGKTLTVNGNAQLHYDTLLSQIWAGFGF